ncbi:hypothetical protein NHQ30_011632 [Ciborinia camelliae]|nr:hypothetical protein NHQ30_011632 [Ciborinia camelliae]
MMLLYEASESGSSIYDAIMIIAIAYRLINFNANGMMKNPTFLEDKFIVWTQTELNYSVISAIIPSLRPFVKNLSTYYGQELGGRSGYTLEDSKNYQLSNLSSIRNHENNHQLEGGRIGEEVVDPDDYKFRVWATQGGLPGAKRNITTAGGTSKLLRKSSLDDGMDGDGLSVGSSDSQRMIIQKDTSWTVRMD